MESNFNGCQYTICCDVLLWTSTYGRAKAGRPAWTYIQQLCEDPGCSPEDLPEAMNDWEEWRERVRDIRASGTTWWWRWQVFQGNRSLFLQNNSILHFTYNWGTDIRKCTVYSRVMIHSNDGWPRISNHKIVLLSYTESNQRPLTLQKYVFNVH